MGSYMWTSPDGTRTAVKDIPNMKLYNTFNWVKRLRRLEPENIQHEKAFEAIRTELIKRGYRIR